MESTAKDANTAADGINQLRSDGNAGMEESSPSNIDNEHFDPNSDNLIETVGEEPGGIDLATGGASKQGEDEGKGKKEEDPKEGATETKEGGEEGETGKDKTGEGKAGDLDYHEIPRFKELEGKVTSETERANKAETELALLKTQTEAPKEELNFKPIGDLTAEEIAEWQNDDPKGYELNMLAQAKHEIMQGIRQETSKNEQLSSVDATYNTYQDKNPDNDKGTGFVQMWDSGVIKTFMAKNPGHNAISAHQSLTLESRTEAAVAEAKKEVIENFKAKRTDGLGAGPSHVPDDTKDDELSTAEKRGGAISVIAGRLFKSRQQGG